MRLPGRISRRIRMVCCSRVVYIYPGLLPPEYISDSTREYWLLTYIYRDLAAKAALRRKKVHEKNLEQTQAQIIQLEQQIYSIEAANINQETLNAMKQAGQAMAQIHGNLTLEKVDETMYVCVISLFPRVVHHMLQQR